MRLTDALMGEHGAFHALLDELLLMTSHAGEIAQIESIIVVLSAEVKRHAALEEKLLFPALLPYLPTDDLIKRMRAEHEEIRQGLERIEDAHSLDQALEAARHALSVLRTHFQHEESVLYAFAEQVLDDKTLRSLGEDWAHARLATAG